MAKPPAPTAPKKERAKIDPNESNADKFARLASIRTSRAYDAIKALKNLSSTVSYEYTPKQIDHIFKVLRDACDASEKAFKEPGTKDKPAARVLSVQL